MKILLIQNVGVLVMKTAFVNIYFAIYTKRRRTVFLNFPYPTRYGSNINSIGSVSGDLSV